MVYTVLRLLLLSLLETSRISDIAVYSYKFYVILPADKFTSDNITADIITAGIITLGRFYTGHIYTNDP